MESGSTPEVETPDIEDVEAEEVSLETSENEEVSQDEQAKVACEEVEKKVAELQAQLEKEKKEYLFLMAEFDNFRKRTLKEKSDIIKNAGENVLKGLLPIMDDFERGIKAAANSPEADSVKEGVNLIYNKFKNYLSQNGVKEFDPSDDTFDADKHEAISVVPVPDEDKKGKILDTVEKGYTINDKVLRHAKVVVGQ
ncbi:MAG: nucleotide exchange factor GrpE [Muribaculaceae bacterium]|nr:nucleotide exchange factor GrpE [Muribaculaceae bacterium]